MRHILSIVASVFMLTGCVEEFDAEMPESESKLLVVNGTIRSNVYSIFQLSWSSSLSSSFGTKDKNNYATTSSSVDRVCGAKIKVCGTDGSEYPCYEYDTNNDGRGSGYYDCLIPELNKDVEYYVQIQIEDDIYESTPEKPIRTPEITYMEHLQRDPQADVDILISTDTPDNPKQTSYFVWDYNETWEVRPRLRSFVYYDLVEDSVICKDIYPARGWKDYRNEKILVGSTVHYAGGQFEKYQLFEIPRDNERIYWNYSAYVTQRAISRGEYEYMVAVRQAGWEMGGLFSPLPSFLPTNIHCTTSDKKAIGYVGCSMNEVGMRMYIDGTTLSRKMPDPSRIERVDPSDKDVCRYMVKQDKALYDYKEGNPGKGPVGYWGELVDFDIRLQSGLYLEKPTYMPPFDNGWE